MDVAYLLVAVKWHPSTVLGESKEKRFFQNKKKE